jgi:GIY-YIG catalytic domain
MLTFNAILRLEGIEPDQVRLVRHQDTRNPRRPTPYMLWRAGDGRLELYQSIQKRMVFQVGDKLASFVGTPLGETLFIGLYEVTGIGKAPPGLIDPVGQHDAGGLILYDIHLAPQLAQYAGHLIIDWGPGHRSWVQHANRKDKAVLEIRREVKDPPFPGFTTFFWNIDEFLSLPPSWREVLKSVQGVYLLVCLESGKPYVGSAIGDESLWGRMKDYFETGHGGNVELKRRGRKPYQFSVLEIVNSDQGIERIEESWKRKLLSREFGLN